MELMILFIVLIGGVLAAGYIGNMQFQRAKRAAPRVTQAEIVAFWSALDAAILPMAVMEVADTPPSSAAQSRIGGAPFTDRENTT